MIIYNAHKKLPRMTLQQLLNVRFDKHQQGSSSVRRMLSEVDKLVRTSLTRYRIKRLNDCIIFAHVFKAKADSLDLDRNERRKYFFGTFKYGHTHATHTRTANRQTNKVVDKPYKRLQSQGQGHEKCLPF